MSAVDIDRLLADASRAMSGLTERLDELATREFVGESKDGLVTAIVTGGRRLVTIDLYPQAARRVNNITLGELVAAALNDAEDQAEAARQEAMSTASLMGIDPAAFIRDPIASVEASGLLPRPES